MSGYRFHDQQHIIQVPVTCFKVSGKELMTANNTIKNYSFICKHKVVIATHKCLYSGATTFSKVKKTHTCKTCQI